MGCMNRVLSISVAVVTVAVAIVGWRLATSRDATHPVNEAQAASALHAAPAARHAAVRPGLRPMAGTYRYVGSGREHLSLLGGSTHVFPATVYGVVDLDAHAACAWRLGLVLVREHVERHGYCTSRAGVRDAGFSRTTSFLGHEQTSKYACTPDAMRLRAAAAVGATWTWSCREARGGVVHFTARRLPDAPLRIGSSTVSTRHVHVVASQHDKSTGSERSDWWLLPSGLPARVQSTRKITTSAGPLGELRNDERYDYRLTSLHAAA
jgi:hypothetical protein